MTRRAPTEKPGICYDCAPPKEFGRLARHRRLMHGSRHETKMPRLRCPYCEKDHRKSNRWRCRKKIQANSIQNPALHLKAIPSLPDHVFDTHINKSSAQYVLNQELRLISKNSIPAHAVYYDDPDIIMKGRADVLIIRTIDQLKDYLKGLLCQPAYLPPDSKAMTMINEVYPLLSPDELIKKIQLPHNKILDAQYLESPLNRHSDLTIAQALEDMKKGPNQRSHNGWNVLDFGIPCQLTPWPIADIDVCRLADIQLMNSHNPRASRKTDDGKENISKGKHITDWGLMSCSGTSSTVHIDDPPFLTHIRMQQGQKIWTFLSQPKQEDREVHRMYGYDPEKYSRKFTQLLLEPNSLFMQPAGTLHHVFTPEDSLVTGGFFLTAKTLAASLRTAEVVDQCYGCTNDDPLPQLHRVFQYVLSIYLDLRTLHEYKITAADVKEVISALQDYKYIPKKPKANMKAHFKNKREFLQVCQQSHTIERLKEQKKHL